VIDVTVEDSRIHDSVTLVTFGPYGHRNVLLSSRPRFSVTVTLTWPPLQTRLNRRVWPLLLLFNFWYFEILHVHWLVRADSVRLGKVRFGSVHLVWYEEALDGWTGPLTSRPYMNRKSDVWVCFIMLGSVRPNLCADLQLKSIQSGYSFGTCSRFGHFFAARRFPRPSEVYSIVSTPKLLPQASAFD
jgi:hypothetical protein